MTSGFYTVTWDAASSQSGNGLFIVRLAVSSQDNQQVQSTKLIIKK